jgi:hypothetical protein
VFPLFASGVVDNGSKFAAGIAASVHLDLYLREFSKKFEMTLMLLGEDDHEENQKQKISLTLFPLIRYCPEDTWLNNSFFFLLWIPNTG